MLHLNGAVRFRRIKGRRQGDVSNIAAGDFEPPRQKIQIQFRSARRGLRPDAAPNAQAVFLARKRKFDDESDAPGESVVDVLPQIGGENGHASVFLHFLQQVGDFNVRVPIVRILNFRAFAKQGVGFVKKQDSVAVFSLGENAVEIFFRLADIFAHHRREIDFVEVQLEIVGDDFGGHGFARAALAGEKRVHALPQRKFGAESPVVNNCAAVFDVACNFTQLLHLIQRQNDVVPAEFWLDLARECREFWLGLFPAAGDQVRDGHLGLRRITRQSRLSRLAGGAADLFTREIKSGREKFEIAPVLRR